MAYDFVWGHGNLLPELLYEVSIPGLIDLGTVTGVKFVFRAVKGTAPELMQRTAEVYRATPTVEEAARGVSGVFRYVPEVGVFDALSSGEYRGYFLPTIGTGPSAKTVNCPNDDTEWICFKVSKEL